MQSFKNKQTHMFSEHPQVREHLCKALKHGSVNDSSTLELIDRFRPRTEKALRWKGFRL